MMRPDEMRNSFVEHGLADVEQVSLLIRMDYASFEITGSRSPPGRGRSAST